MDEEGLREMERLGELYRRAMLNVSFPASARRRRRRKVEKNMRKRGEEVCSQWNISPDYPCVRGVVPLGSDSQESIDDGHKFACGVMHIGRKVAPVVYSFGSNRKQDFELSFLKLRPDAEVHTFDILADHLPPPLVRSSSVTYNVQGLGGWEASDGSTSSTPLKPLADLMLERGHTYIDVLKMDIEGFEWAWVEHEADIAARVGQLLIEVHVNCNGRSASRYPHKNFLSMLEALELRGLRLFWKELNPVWPETCSEFSLVQQEWGKWEERKRMLPPLKPYAPPRPV